MSTVCMGHPIELHGVSDLGRYQQCWLDGRSVRCVVIGAGSSHSLVRTSTGQDEQFAQTDPQSGAKHRGKLVAVASFTGYPWDREWYGDI